MNNLRIVFLGTPEFAVASLDILVRNDFKVVGVVTSPDKPSGRGLQVHTSAVKDYAFSKKIKILQPEKLQNEDFIKELRSLNADLQIVVAFRMLPEIVWNMPRMGTVNLHASLLPQYRGAAPINWAIIKGEKETGVSTFSLQHQIDTGNVILRKSVELDDDITAGELHDKLMFIGADVLLETVKLIANDNYIQTPQCNFNIDNLKHAPKIFKDDCWINWNLHIDNIHNHIRGLSPSPSAQAILSDSKGKEYLIKIYRSKKEMSNQSEEEVFKLKQVITDNKTFLKIKVNGGFIHITELQLSGKKRMNTEDFLRGFNLSNDSYFVK